MKFDVTKLNSIDEFEQEFASRLTDKIRVELETEKAEIANELLVQPTQQEDETSGDNI